MTFRAGGLMSGLDTNTMIEQLVSLERAPIRKLEQRQQTLSQKRATIADIESALTDLQTSMQQLDSVSAFMAYDASSSNADVLGVTASGEANEGSHSVQVLQKARAEQDRSQAFTDSDAQVKAGTLTITAQGEDAVDVTIDAGDSLADVAYKINTSGARVSAAIIDTGSACHLTLYALDSGHQVGTAASEALTVVESYNGASGLELSLTETQQAQNARIDFDGLEVERRSNTMSDVIPGLTLNVLDDTGQPSTTITVQPDTESFRTQVDSFVADYNQVMSLLHAQLSYAEGQQTGALFGDGTLKSLQRQLQSMIADEVGGADGLFQMLGQVGIDTNAEGGLTIDEIEFNQAVAEDVRGVAALFTTESQGVFAKLDTVIERFNDPVDGMLKIKRDSIDAQDSDLDDQIERLELRVDAYEKQLITEFTHLETVLSELESQQGALTSLASLVG